jgi:hypothetical protein
MGGRHSMLWFIAAVTAEILDDQFDDRATQDCVTLTTAPRFFYTLTIPG